MLVGFLILFFLMLESRRYRYFNVWRARARWMERHLYYAPMLDDGALHMEEGWRQTAAAWSATAIDALQAGVEVVT